MVVGFGVMLFVVGFFCFWGWLLIGFGVVGILYFGVVLFVILFIVFVCIGVGGFCIGEIFVEVVVSMIFVFFNCIWCG